MEFWGKDFDADRKSLLGLTAAKNWILYAPYVDESLIRNAFLYNISRQMGNWAPHTAFCEVFIVSEGKALTMTEAYKGVYVAMERVDNERMGMTGRGPRQTGDESGDFILKVP